MQGLREAAAELAAMGRRPKTLEARFLPLDAPAASENGFPPAPCAAVDGSHAVLVDNGPLWVVATRATAILCPGNPQAEAEATIHLTTPDEAQPRLDTAYAEWGLEAPRARNAEGFAEALRSLDEAKQSVQAVAILPKGCLLLVDGALHGLPPAPQALADRILGAAERAGVEAVGVSKRSAIASSGVPWVATLQRDGPEGMWAAEVEAGVYVARLHARARHAFRVDAGSHATVSRLASYCRDAVYTGYPYPLAVAHNAVALTGAHVRDLKARLFDEVRRVGGAEAAALLADFHETLDRNV